MKKLFAIVITVFTLSSHVFGNVNEELVFSFNKSFPSAQDAKWSKDANGYLVSFTQYGILSKVVYNIDGDFLYALRYYSEENLPVSILVRIKEKFPNKKIFAVTEVSTSDDINYHVKLEDAKKCYGIMVTPSGTITMEERFERRDP
jgi:hypothetical protein